MQYFILLFRWSTTEGGRKRSIFAEADFEVEGRGTMERRFREGRELLDKLRNKVLRLPNCKDVTMR